MAAPKLNQFWKNRTEHGRHNLFNSPELVWEESCKYFEYCDTNPIETLEFNGKDAVECIVPKMRAYTITGLCVYLDCAVHTFDALKEKEDFLPIYTRIRQIIYTQKFEGAAAGVLNANIIARDLGLAEKHVNDTTHSLTDEMLKLLSDKING